MVMMARTSHCAGRARRREPNTAALSQSKRQSTVSVCLAVFWLLILKSSRACRQRCPPNCKVRFSYREFLLFTSCAL
ncbi:hypothetical protein PILCRDRAFT_738559 [Piloderma croceum F 1598]|uniref:Uncharacterized protein n=1 Tax=Piloderma croceum (strain F 1598) TaxID=765440 RepID=A0A0C3EXK6_PILCF|nr:hypothetical protein PILCRDRAFT_738559 [Piloderma croceum F 1598]